METIALGSELMLINTKRYSFNIMEIRNRRFMFSPQSGELILGKQYQDSRIHYSHAEEYAAAAATAPFDSFVRGWIGTSREYKNGVIHFAPAVDSQNKDLFDRAFATLEMYSENGAKNDTVIRGFGKAWERPLEEILKGEKR